MGSYLSTGRRLYQGIKRSYSSAELNDKGDSNHGDDLNMPKRRKLKSTSEYIFEALYQRGEGSDVCVSALGHTWHLHKIYLCQSGYFNSMFSRNWKESSLHEINIDIVDENIDKEALDVMFGSLYRDEFEIKPSNVIGLLAAAIHFSLEDVIQQCVSIMLDNISAQTVCYYHSAGLLYGQKAVIDACVSWLENNLLLHPTVELLRELSTELISELISSKDLVVIQVEMDVYSLLRKWLFIKLQNVTEWFGSASDLHKDIDNYFKIKGLEWKESETGCFLNSAEGRSYSKAFEPLRLNHILVDYGSFVIIENDAIIPTEWLNSVCRSMLLTILKTDHSTETGPAVDGETEFELNAFRCGRIIPKHGDYCWRWTGYNFGIDLLISFTGRVILLKRNTLSHPSNGSVSLAAERKLLYRISLMSYDSKGQVKFCQKTPVKELTLKKDEETIVLVLERSLRYPIHVSCRFLTYVPFQPVAT